jgi:hypothetical protein
MGQARNRGSFEDRKSKSIVDHQERIEQLKRQKALAELNMTEEEREARKRSRHRYNTFMAIAAGSMLR